MSTFFSQTSEGFIEKIKQSEVPPTVMKDFNDGLFKIEQPRRRLLNLLLCFPVDGALFILSASIMSLLGMENEMITAMIDTLELVSNLAMLSAIIILIYSAIQLVRLGRELA